MEQNTGKTVLIVDDGNMFFIEQMLQKSGYRVLSGKNGNDFIKYAGDKIDVVLLDNRMPEKSGLEALAELHQAGEKVGGKIIMISSDLDEEQMKKATSYGVVDFLPKPFPFASLLEKLRQYC